MRVWNHNGTRASDEHTLTHDMYGTMEASTVLGSNGGTSVVVMGPGGGGGGGCNKKEVSFNLEPEFEMMERRPESQQSMRSTIDSHAGSTEIFCDPSV